MSRFMMVAATAAVLASIGIGQGAVGIEGSTPGTTMVTHAPPANDPTNIPFPPALDAAGLQSWALACKATLADRLVEARLRHDANEVARLVVLSEKVRAHALVLIKRLQAEAGVVPGAPPAPAPAPAGAPKT